jgi:hypothetical protein
VTEQAAVAWLNNWLRQQHRPRPARLGRCWEPSCCWRFPDGQDRWCGEHEQDHSAVCVSGLLPDSERDRLDHLLSTTPAGSIR